MPDIFGHLSAIAGIIGVLWAFMQHKSEISKWRGIVETKLEQGEKDREILHSRIDDKEEDTKKRLNEMQTCLKELTRKVDILVDRNERK